MGFPKLKSLCLWDKWRESQETFYADGFPKKCKNYLPYNGLNSVQKGSHHLLIVEISLLHVFPSLVNDDGDVPDKFFHLTIAVLHRKVHPISRWSPHELSKYYFHTRIKSILLSLDNMFVHQIRCHVVLIIVNLFYYQYAHRRYILSFRPRKILLLFKGSASYIWMYKEMRDKHVLYDVKRYTCSKINKDRGTSCFRNTIISCWYYLRFIILRRWH